MALNGQGVEGEHQPGDGDQVFHDDSGGMVFDKITHERPYSDDTAREIDGEVEALIKEAATRAQLVIESNRESLNEMAQALIKEETIEDKAVEKIFAKTKLPQAAKLH